MVNIPKYNCMEAEYGNPTMRDAEDGEYVETIRYAALLARHNALVKAVKEEIAARDHDYYDYFWRCNDATTEDELRENYAELDAARAEVGRLIANETADDCEGEG